jgi:dephospho-CoA kinase
MNVVGFTGPIRSGKSTAAHIMEGRGYRYFSLTDEVVAEFENRNTGREITRHDKQDIGNEMRLTFGDDYWARRTGEKITAMLDKEGPFNIVIDGIFNPAEIDWFEENLGMITIGVDADLEIRLRRMGDEKRGAKQSDLVLSEDDRRRALIRDLGDAEPRHGQKVNACLAKAGKKVIRNDVEGPGWEMALTAELDRMLAILGIGEGSQNRMARR